MKNRIFILSIIIPILFLFSCRSSKPDTSDRKPIEYDASDVVKKAKKYLGTKYRSGGKNPGSGFDCSGFTSYIFGEFGIKLPPTSAQQSQIGTSIDQDRAQKGDLIFFKSGDAKSKAVGHVGIVVGGRGDDIEFIHASSSKGIMISKLEEKYFKKRFVRIKRISNRN